MDAIPKLLGPIARGNDDRKTWWAAHALFTPSLYEQRGRYRKIDSDTFSSEYFGNREQIGGRFSWSLHNRVTESNWSHS